MRVLSSRKSRTHVVFLRPLSNGTQYGLGTDKLTRARGSWMQQHAAHHDFFRHDVGEPINSFPRSAFRAEIQYHLSVLWMACRRFFRHCYYTTTQKKSRAWLPKMAKHHYIGRSRILAHPYVQGAPHLTTLKSSGEAQSYGRLASKLISMGANVHAL